MKEKDLRKQEIAQKIKNARIAAGLTQAQIAEKLGITYQAVSNYERGKNSIETDLLFKMCEIYGVNPVPIISPNFYTCPICGFDYDSSLQSGIEDHNYHHKLFCRAVEHYGFCYRWDELGMRKNKVFDILYSESAGFEKKYDAAVELFKVYFSRSIGQNGYSLDHPQFEEYVAMLLNQNQFRKQFGNEIYDSLVKKYGKKSGIPENRTTYRIWELTTEITPAAHKPKKFAPNEAEAAKLAQDFQKLDSWGKKQVRAVVNNELARCTAEHRKRVKATAEIVGDMVGAIIPFRRSYQPASAGTGIYLGPDEFETIYVQENPLTRKASFGVPVSGDSMEPDYHDGDVLLVERADDIKIGEVGVFTIDGDGYVKQRGDGELISLNPAYDPIQMSERIRCNGRVIGILKPAWIVEK